MNMNNKNPENRLQRMTFMKINSKKLKNRFQPMNLSRWTVLALTILMLITAACNPVPNPNDPQQRSVTGVELPTPVGEQSQTIETTGDAWLDNKLQIAATAPRDTNLALLYYQIGRVYMTINLQKTKEYYLKLRDLSELLQWRKGAYLFATGFSDLLNREGLTDSSLVVQLQALEVVKNDL
jgi:hypothetical protein